MLFITKVHYLIMHYPVCSDFFTILTAIFLKRQKIQKSDHIARGLSFWSSWPPCRTSPKETLLPTRGQRALPTAPPSAHWSPHESRASLQPRGCSGIVSSFADLETDTSKGVRAWLPHLQFWAGLFYLVVPPRSSDMEQALLVPVSRGSCHTQRQQSHHWGLASWRTL